MTHSQVAVALGAADCEAWRPGLLHQPVNALSSLAFVVAGVWVALRAAADHAPDHAPDHADRADRAGRADRAAVAIYAGALIGNGAGSFLYHGPGWPGSAFVHDAAVPAALLFIAVEDVALLRGWTDRRRLCAYALGLGAACTALTVAPAASVAVTAAAGALAGAAEAAVAIAARRGPGGPAREAPAPATIALGAAALAALLAGRTGSPLCDPEGPLQGHALWHVLAAAALLGWDGARRARRAARAAGRVRVKSPVPWGGPGSR
ncbi:MAG TPA: hypothetical protein VFU43_08960 [Streptosporangiaceae bacterium]|nr:hypothetical protein [Streptosporangiaceae bacterium]